MDKLLMAKFKPPTQQWDANQPGYHGKAFRLVLNRYNRNGGIDPRKDMSETYDARHPTTSLSYGRGSILTIQDSNKPAKLLAALYYQFLGDAIIMSGELNLQFYHGIPAVETWQELFKTQNIARHLPQDEFDEAKSVIDGTNAHIHERFNVTIR